MYKLRRFENDSIKTYNFDSYESLKLWIDKEIDKFKIVNCVKDETKDKSFIRFKIELDGLMEDYLKCEKCAECDHEGVFCRCESRNIAVAKEKRKNCESPWIKNNEVDDKI